MTTILACVLFSTCTWQPDFILDPASLTPGAEDVPATAALGRARELARALDLDTSGQPVLRLYVNDDAPRIWEVEWPDQVTVDLISRDRSLFALRNTKRSDDRTSMRGRTGTMLYSGQTQAVEAIRRQALAVGMPSQAVLTRYESRGDDANGRKGEGMAGLHKAWFAMRPRGIGFINGAPSGVYVVDSQDGEIIEIHQRWDVDVEADVERITNQEAVGLAHGYYEHWYEGRRGRQEYDPAHPPRLHYAVPNGVFDGLKYPASGRLKGRLAWVVSFGKDMVFIDAGNGRLLGGGRG